MKKKTRAFLALPVLALLICAGYALAEGDGLVSLTYLTSVFFPQAQSQGEAAVRDKLQQTYDGAMEQLDKAQRETLGQAGLYSETLEGREWSDGDVVTLPTGSGFLLFEGTAVISHGGAAVDVTQGGEIASDTLLTPGHRGVVGEDTTARITVLSGAAVLGVQGNYSCSRSGKAATPFYDVCQTDWYYAPVGYVYRNGLFAGMERHKFGPDTTMNRAMLMTVLYRLSGLPEDELAAAGGLAFSDVPEGAWFAPYVRWGAAQGITRGTSATTFSPEELTARDQLLVMLYRFAGGYLKLSTQERADLSIFQDRDQIGDWAEDAISWAVYHRIIGDASAGQQILSPHSPASRAEVAAMLQAFSQNVLGRR